MAFGKHRLAAASIVDGVDGGYFQTILGVNNNPETPYTLNRVLPDCYLGPVFSKDKKEANPKSDNFRWPHMVFFRALAAQGEATNDPRIPAAMPKHYLSDRAPYAGPSREVTNVEGGRAVQAALPFGALRGE